MSASKAFRKRPVEIEAMQWDGTPEGATPIINWIVQNDGSVTYECSDVKRCRTYEGDCPHWLAIRTREGDMRATLGDWIIRGVQGEFYPCKPDIFAQTYEAIDDGDADHQDSVRYRVAEITQDLSEQGLIPTLARIDCELIGRAVQDQLRTLARTVEQLTSLHTGSIIRNPKSNEVYQVDHGPHGEWLGPRTQFHGIGSYGMGFVLDEIAPWLPYEVLHATAPDPHQEQK